MTSALGASNFRTQSPPPPPRHICRACVISFAAVGLPTGIFFAVLLSFSLLQLTCARCHCHLAPPPPPYANTALSEDQGPVVPSFWRIFWGLRLLFSSTEVRIREGLLDGCEVWCQHRSDLTQPQPTQRKLMTARMTVQKVAPVYSFATETPLKPNSLNSSNLVISQIDLVPHAALG